MQAEAVVQHCKGLDLRRVVISIGGQIFPFDTLRLQTCQGLLAEHPCIDVVAVG